MDDPRSATDYAKVAIRARFAALRPTAGPGDLDALVEAATGTDLWPSYVQGRPHLADAIAKEVMDGAAGIIVSRRHAAPAEPGGSPTDRMAAWRASGGRS